MYFVSTDYTQLIPFNLSIIIVFGKYFKALAVFNKLNIPILVVFPPKQNMRSQSTLIPFFLFLCLSH